MRNKRMINLFTLLGLLAALTMAAYATTSAHPAAPNVVGTWIMKIAQTATAPETNETMQTFFADGNYLETNNNSAAGSTRHVDWFRKHLSLLISGLHDR